jgi:hypothetical protein
MNSWFLCAIGRLCFGQNRGGLFDESVRHGGFVRLPEDFMQEPNRVRLEIGPARASPAQRQVQAEAPKSKSALFDAVALLDFGVGKPRFAFVAHAGFGQVKIVVQALQFLAQRGDLLALLMDCADHGSLCGLRVRARRSSGYQALIYQIVQR